METSPPEIPPELRRIKAFVHHARELDDDRNSLESPIVAHYCRMYAAQEGIRYATSTEGNQFLEDLVERIALESEGLSSISQEESRGLCRQFANNIFDRADEEDKAGTAGRSAAELFYSAAVYYEALQQFYDFSEDEVRKEEERQWVYCIRRAVEIFRTVGRRPASKNSTIRNQVGENEAQIVEEMCPSELKHINAFICRAERLDDDDSVEARIVAFYCRMYAAIEGASCATSEESEMFLIQLMNKIEPEKEALSCISLKESHDLCKKFANDNFEAVNMQDEAGDASRETAEMFHATSILYETLQQFHENSTENMQKCKEQKEEEKKILYSLRRAVDIFKEVEEEAESVCSGADVSEVGTEREIEGPENNDKLVVEGMTEDVPVESQSPITVMDEGKEVISDDHDNFIDTNAGSDAKEEVPHIDNDLTALEPSFETENSMKEKERGGEAKNEVAGSNIPVLKESDAGGHLSELLITGETEKMQEVTENYNGINDQHNQRNHDEETFENSECCDVSYQGGVGVGEDENEDDRGTEPSNLKCDDDYIFFDAVEDGTLDRDGQNGMEVGEKDVEDGGQDGLQNKCNDNNNLIGGLQEDLIRRDYLRQSSSSRGSKGEGESKIEYGTQGGMELEYAEATKTATVASFSGDNEKRKEGNGNYIYNSHADFGGKLLNVTNDMSIPVTPSAPLLDEDTPSSNKPPINTSFLDPITHEIMVEPVICDDGFTYDRQTIEAHFQSELETDYRQQNQFTSPMTGDIITNSLLHNRNVEMQIVESLEERNMSVLDEDIEKWHRRREQRRESRTARDKEGRNKKEQQERPQPDIAAPIQQEEQPSAERVRVDRTVTDGTILSEHDLGLSVTLCNEDERCSLHYASLVGVGNVPRCMVACCAKRLDNDNDWCARCGRLACSRCLEFHVTEYSALNPNQLQSICFECVTQIIDVMGDTGTEGQVRAFISNVRLRRYNDSLTQRAIELQDYQVKMNAKAQFGPGLLELQEEIRRMERAKDEMQVQSQGADAGSQNSFRSIAECEEVCAVLTRHYNDLMERGCPEQDEEGQIRYIAAISAITDRLERAQLTLLEMRSRPSEVRSSGSRNTVSCFDGIDGGDSFDNLESICEQLRMQYIDLRRSEVPADEFSQIAHIEAISEVSARLEDAERKLVESRSNRTSTERIDLEDPVILDAIGVRDNEWPLPFDLSYPTARMENQLDLLRGALAQQLGVSQQKYDDEYRQRRQVLTERHNRLANEMRHIQGA